MMMIIIIILIIHVILYPGEWIIYYCDM